MGNLSVDYLCVLFSGCGYQHFEDSAKTSQKDFEESAKKTD